MTQYSGIFQKVFTTMLSVIQIVIIYMYLVAKKHPEIHNMRCAKTRLGILTLYKLFINRIFWTIYFDDTSHLSMARSELRNEYKV